MYFPAYLLFQVKSRGLNKKTGEIFLFFFILSRTCGGWIALSTLLKLLTGYQFSACKTKMDLLSKTVRKCTSFKQVYFSFSKIITKLTLYLSWFEKSFGLINYLKNCLPNGDVAYVSSFGSLIFSNNNRNYPQYWAYSRSHVSSSQHCIFYISPWAF